MKKSLNASKKIITIVTFILPCSFSRPMTGQISERDTSFNKSSVLGVFVPRGLIGGGLALNNADFKQQQRDYRQTNFPDFKHNLDDFMQFTPHVTVFALDGLGIKVSIILAIKLV